MLEIAVSDAGGGEIGEERAPRLGEGSERLPFAEVALGEGGEPLPFRPRHLEDRVDLACDADAVGLVVERDGAGYVGFGEVAGDGAVADLLVRDVGEETAHGEAAGLGLDGEDGGERSRDRLRQAERVRAGRPGGEHGIGERRRRKLERFLVVARRGERAHGSGTDYGRKTSSTSVTSSLRIPSSRAAATKASNAAASRPVAAAGSCARR